MEAPHRPLSWCTCQEQEHPIQGFCEQNSGKSTSLVQVDLTKVSNRNFKMDLKKLSCCMQKHQF